MSKRREMAIKRRRRFILTVVLVFAVIAGIIMSVVSCGSKGKNKEFNVSAKAESTASFNESKTESLTESTLKTLNGLDAEYGNLMLVNGSNPLPDNYDSEIRSSLVEIDKDLRNNDYVTKIHKTVYPYITAMVKAAQNDGVELKVWSPFRSYADQEALFKKQVARTGGDEKLAATVVARPGTSEHNTGICADFNMADDAFENTPMYTWMCENAENYGFILRYPKSKQDKTGVIYESWHWRFVGINNAKAINKSGLCLEEYLEQNNIEQEIDINNF